mmetsp:Transcript_8527/g.12910  ORF Transcript_8527/g.12910 Transcript_8527/m.12910 type:complete len:136 (-) Transcript_8527:2617-3024(-)
MHVQKEPWQLSWIEPSLIVISVKLTSILYFWAKAMRINTDVLKNGIKVSKILIIPVANSAKGRKVVLRDKITFETSKRLAVAMIEMNSESFKRHGVTSFVQKPSLVCRLQMDIVSRLIIAISYQFQRSRRYERRL